MPRMPPSLEMTDLQLGADEVKRLHRILDGSTGVDLSYYTTSFLTRRIAVRMRQLGITVSTAYLTRLETDPAERIALVTALTINVTEFFRDPGVYEALRLAAIPALLKSAPRQLTAWSAGCATGEEPYTVAMLLDEALANRPGFSYIVHASDSNPRQLELAQTATYPVKSTAHVPARYLNRYFSPAQDGLVAISPALKANVRFLRHDLSTGAAAPAKSLDLILCRNVMIYFSPEAKETMLRAFQRMLAPEGFLVLGGAEVILRSDCLLPFDAVNKIYRAAKAANG